MAAAGPPLKSNDVVAYLCVVLAVSSLALWAWHDSGMKRSKEGIEVLVEGRKKGKKMDERQVGWWW